eukprot:PhM_4_TR7212/c0_g1_i1/m.104218
MANYSTSSSGSESDGSVSTAAEEMAEMLDANSSTPAATGTTTAVIVVPPDNDNDDSSSSDDDDDDTTSSTPHTATTATAAAFPPSYSLTGLFSRRLLAPVVPTTTTPSTARTVQFSGEDPRSTPVLLRDEPSSYIYAACPPAIAVNDIIHRILLFIPADARTLLNVSHVCRAWKERVEWMPQWKKASNMKAYDRASYLEGKKSQYEYRRQKEKHEKRRIRDGTRQKWQTMVFAWIMFTLIGLGSLAVAWAVGHGKNSSSGDVPVSLGAFFSVLLASPLPLVMIAAIALDMLRRLRNVTQGTDDMKKRLIIAMILVFSVCVSAAVPLALFGTRIRSLQLIRDAPVLTITCNTTYKDMWWAVDSRPPAFVRLDVSTLEWSTPNSTSSPEYSATLVSSKMGAVELISSPVAGSGNNCRNFTSPDTAEAARPRLFLILPKERSTENRSKEIIYQNRSNALLSPASSSPLNVWPPRRVVPRIELNATKNLTASALRNNNNNTLLFRTPFYTHYFSANVANVGQEWYAAYGGRWHLHRHVALRLPVEYYTGEGAEGKEEVETDDDDDEWDEGLHGIYTPGDVDDQLQAHHSKVVTILAVVAGVLVVGCWVVLLSGLAAAMTASLLIVAWCGLAPLIAGAVCMSAEVSCIGLTDMGAFGLVMAGSIASFISMVFGLRLMQM